MKKLIIGIVTVLIGLFITIQILGANEYKVEETSREDIIAQFENKEDFLLVMGGSTCHWCIKYKKETLPDYDQNDDEFPLSFIYSDKGFKSQSDFQTFLRKYDLTYNSSPTTYLIRDGKLVAFKEGFLVNSELESWINENK